MQIEFNGDIYDVEITSSTPYVDATHDDPSEGGEIEFTIELDGVEIEQNLFTDSEWEEIDGLVFEKNRKDEEDDRGDYLMEQARDRDNFY